MTARDSLEEGLSGLMEALGPDLDRMRRVSPHLASILVQTSVSLLVLEYVLQAKGLVAREELMLAVAEAQGVVRRLGGVPANA